MEFDADTCYRALESRDGRFDGLFFVAVKTTGIYCRPVCRARTPGRSRCVFYRCAAEAERAGFRACRRCRPELAPGSAPIDAMPRIAAAALLRIESGALDEAPGNLESAPSLDALARALGVSGRHLRRAVHAGLGVTPMELVQSRRLALARQLLYDTELPLSQVAFASGFRSIRRFNAAFRARCGHAPSALRRSPPAGRGDLPPDTVSLTLGLRAPYDFPALLAFLRPRALPGVEVVEEDRYLRTVRCGGCSGWLSVSALDAPPGRPALRAVVSLSLLPVLLPVVGRLRRLFDLDAQPQLIAEWLGRDPLLRPLLQARPGLRVPGAFDGFEAALRAILGQQVSVAAATTLCGRLVAAFGKPLRPAAPHPGLTHLVPGAARLAAAAPEELRALGLPAARARTLQRLAAALKKRRLALVPQPDPGPVLAALQELPGIGPWTAHYIALRALGWPDAFPAEDLGLRRALGADLAPAAVRERAERWRPWRAYAVLHLWTALAERSIERSEP